MSTRELIAFAKRQGVVFGIVDDRLVVTGLRRLSKRRQGEVRAAREAIFEILARQRPSKGPATLQEQQQALVDRALVAVGLPAGAIRVGRQCRLACEMTGGLVDEALRAVAYSVAPILAAIPEPEPPPPGAKLPHGNITIWR